jgi:hypothetical protein
MLRQEEQYVNQVGAPNAADTPDPRFVEAIATNTGAAVYVDRETMRVSTCPPEPLVSCGGGCLCDDPGLGKTVSCIALMLATLGCRSDVAVQQSPAARRREIAEGIYAEWRSREAEPVAGADMWSHRYRRKAMTVVNNKLKEAWEALRVKQHRKDDEVFYSPLAHADVPAAWRNPAVVALLEEHLHPAAEGGGGGAADADSSCSYVWELLEEGEIFPHDGDNGLPWDGSIDQIEAKVASVFTPWATIPAGVLLQLRRLVGFGRVSAVVNTATRLLRKLPKLMRQFELEVAGTLMSFHREHSRATEQVPLLSSGATLVVVPPHMVAHWTDQIRRSTLAGAVLEETGVSVFVEGARKRWVTRQSQPYFERSRKDALPAANELAACWVVVISSDRLKSAVHDETNGSASLFEVKWLRLLVDEGDMIGSGTSTNTNVNLKMIHAQHRWIITGTPTPIKDSSDTGLSRLRFLVQFVGLSPFDAAADPAGKRWQRLIQRPVDSGRRFDGLVRLQQLLQTTMIRHSKHAIGTLQKPTYHEVTVELSEMERDNHNILAGFIKLNLVLTGMCVRQHKREAEAVGKVWVREEDPMWKASLLHPKMFNTKGYSGKESEGAAGDKKSLLFLFFLLGNSARSQFLPRWNSDLP